MDVNSLGQGRQNAVDFNYDAYSSSTDSENTIQSASVENSDSPKNINSGQNDLKQRQVVENDVKNATDKLNKLFEGKETHVEYDFVGKSRTISVKIIDDKTNDVIKEIPPKKIIEMIDKLCEMAGIMIDEKA